MNISFFLSNIIYLKTNALIPNIVIGMLLSVITVNLNHKTKFFDFNLGFFDFLQNISLGIFLTMALMSIDICTLSSLLGPVVLIVFCQVIFVLFYSLSICFKLLDKSYDAAIMISGLIGHTLGATPNALANMSTLTDKYGKSEDAFLIVPIVAAFLLDAFSVPCILFFINFLK
ncbi:sodium/glutamate symporter, partial [Intestinibacter sp.]|uniref:sodium/glutamate symporter n=1 Tax=Intestinibacter sp. TaxID=1965304 RepID=UPI002A760CA9